MATEYAYFQSRDIGYGVERGEVTLPALDGPDWTGERPYRLIWSTAADGIENDPPIVYLFDDELIY